jgi:carnosine N-methyltransferase
MKKVQEYSIYPFIHSFSNIKSDEKQLSPVMIPDILPANLPSTVDFSMVAGDFIEVYGSQENNKGKVIIGTSFNSSNPLFFLLIGAWDVVVTCFFMDTAKNIIEYMEVIHKTLKQNGTWINIGKIIVIN